MNAYQYGVVKLLVNFNMFSKGIAQYEVCVGG
jgi:hypothetical protein